MLLLHAQGWIKTIVLQVYIIIVPLFNSAFIPGGECQEENKEKEIHQLWDGEFYDESIIIFIRKFSLNGLYEALQLC